MSLPIAQAGDMPEQLNLAGIVPPTTRIKIRHVYTVVREREVLVEDLPQEISDMRGISDEAGEYLYGGANDDSITVILQKQDGKKWKKIG